MYSVTLRQASRQDADFLYKLTKATMREYVAQIWGWDEDWQRSYFKTHFDPNKEQVIVLDGRDVGVLAIVRQADEIFLSKIYILPAYQGQGIGTQLIRSLMADAFDRGVPVALRVLRTNHSAKRLYERLGFEEVGETETHYLMRAIPDQ